MNEMWEKYADLLVNYCLEIQPKDRLLVKSTYIAEPLLQALYKKVYEVGGTMEAIISIKDQESIIYNAVKSDDQLKHTSPLLEKGMKEYEAYLYIMSPFLEESTDFPKDKAKIAKEARKPLMEIYSKRTATRDMKRSLCVFPCEALAKNAGMSLEEYTNFVFEGCKLNEENPREAWLEVRKNQQKVTDHLNNCTKVRYVNQKSDITFNTEGRTWINSDGQTNMPSGEVYTSPVEDSVNGTIFFDKPSIYLGTEVHNVTLKVVDGKVIEWKAEKGQDILDHVMQVPGANFFGECAIGTNYSIQRITKNTLFDEKMGGTVHMALGNSYIQAGGKNKSSVHWDLITDMTQGGKIYADDVCIYENGIFLI